MKSINRNIYVFLTKLQKYVKIIIGDKMNIENLEVKKELKIVFMGTPEFAIPILNGLIENYSVKGVVTQPDRKVGREGKISEPPIKKLALDNMILVLQPEKIKEQWQDVISLHPNLIITCAYGQILPREILVYPEYGCINVHASLLPKLRGGAPIHHAIIDGHKETGITIMHMSPEMDKGDIIAQEKIEIDDTDTASTLHDKLSTLGRDLLLKTLPSIIDKTAPRIKQNEEEATYGYNITKEDEKIDFSATRKQIYNKVRGLNSWPGAYAILDGKRIKIWKCYISDNNFSGLIDGQITNLYEDGIGVKVSNGEIIITELQPEGKKRMSAISYMNGLQNKNELIGKIVE